MIAAPPGNARMVELMAAIREGAMAFLRRQYTVLGLFVVIVAILIFAIPEYRLLGALAYIIGAVSSAGAGFVGMRIATAANTTVILGGLATGMRSNAPSIGVIPVAIVAACVLGSLAIPGDDSSGIYGVALGAVGMLSITAITVNVDAYGPIADNAGGIAQMADLPPPRSAATLMRWIRSATRPPRWPRASPWDPRP